MHLPSPVLSVAVVALAAAACASGPGGSPDVPGSAAAPSSAAAGGETWLRATTSQAIPPQDRFGIPPAAVITADGTWVTQGPMMAIYPGPLLPNLVGRTVTEAGRRAVLAEAARLGLLGGITDFTGGGGMPGALLGTIELTVDGSEVVLTGDPSAQIMCVTTPCDPPPGTPAAFADLFAKLQAPESWVAGELGPEAPFAADAYALLIGPPPAQEPGLGGPPMDWPLAQPVATFGGPVLDGSYRCGTASGADADALRPALQEANQLTQWVQDPAMSATFGITPRPVIGDEDPCAALFGPG